MSRALLVSFAAVFAAVSAPSLELGAQVSLPGQVTPVRPVPGTTTPTGTAVIRGAVVAMDTGTPLGRVQIRAFGSTPDARGSRATSTDDQGRFELRELPAGRYNVHATKAGFVSLQFGQRWPNERGTTVEVADGQTVEKITIALPRGAVITGRISDDAGEPAAGVRVQILRSMFTRGGRRPMPAGREDQTDDLGAFRIYGLAPGEYYVSATFNNMMAMMTDARLAAGDSDQGFAPTYYPGTPGMGEAQRVSVAVGQQVDGISFALMPTRLSRISGRVIGWTAARGPGFVMAMPEEGMGTGPMLPPGQVQPEGDFEMRGIPPGRYVLRVQPRGPREADELVGLTAVSVTGTDLANVTIAIQPPGTMSGRIEFEGGTPATVRASQARVMVEPTDLRGFQIMSGPPEVADDFTFRVRGAMGAVLLRVAGPPGWHLKSTTIGGEDVTDIAMPLTPGAKLEDVRVLLTQAVTTVSGAVRDDRDNVVVDATVLVFPDDDAHWTFSSRFIRTTRPDTEGRFEFRALPPSNGYRILALPSLEDGQAYDPDFLSSVRSRADRLSLNEGEAKTVELRLRP
jgi:hypothetical protein